MSNPEVMSKHKENQWSNYALRIILNTASHPFEYAKILIQIGHEPIAPRPSKTFFGNPTLKLPNIFQYVKHINNVDGFAGLYTGLAPKVCGSLLSAIAVEKCTEYLKLSKLEDLDDEEDTEELRKHKFLNSLACDLINHTAAIAISQPFHVITIRMMAQFVGKETKYMGIFDSVKEIYHQNGILGFFSGLMPRLLGDILTLLLAGCLTYTINRYLVKEKELQLYTATTMNFISTTVMYPFQVVSTCMAVSNSGLLVGSPPFMPHYKTWMECWINLSRHKQLKRGSSVLVRYYTGPSITVGGKLLPVH
ncbi:mitochondrial carrier homolog 2-like [Euwallacea fornicatus]|uniref:mitochondrial carrier homolog 2-like n=1 Tax=Euwallacea fornicatus TaxID=995702 RepID=UPI00338D9EB9